MVNGEGIELFMEQFVLVVIVIMGCGGNKSGQELSRFIWLHLSSFPYRGRSCRTEFLESKAKNTFSIEQGGRKTQCV
jgi:hypothetical protein